MRGPLRRLDGQTGFLYLSRLFAFGGLYIEDADDGEYTLLLGDDSEGGEVVQVVPLHLCTTCIGPSEL